MHIRTTNKNHHWVYWLSLSLVAFILIIIHIRLHPYAFDDAYIHFRIARNLLETGKPYFNINEAIKASTSSGWVIVLTILMVISRLFKMGENNFPLLVSIFNALVVLSSTLVYTKIIRRVAQSEPPSIFIFLFQLSFAALILPSSIGLMESPFALLLTGWGIYCLLQSKQEGFLLLGAAIYIRLELVIVILLAAILAFHSKNFRVKDIVIFSGLGVMPFLLYDLFYYHTFIPHSIIAKSIVYSIPALHPIGYVLLFSLPTIPMPSIGNAVLLICILFFTLDSLIRNWRRSKNYWMVLFYVWGVLTCSGYILGHALIFDWYIPLYTVPILIACFLCANEAKQLQGIFLKTVLYILSFTLSIAILKTISASFYHPDTFSLFKDGARVRNYIRVGAILNEEYPNSSLLAPEIGGLGYSFKGEIVDAVGLASHDALKYHPMRVPEERAFGDLGAIPPGYVKDAMPDLIVSYDLFAQALLEDQVLADYNIIQIPALLTEDAIYLKDKTVWGNKYLRIYIRKGLPISERITKLEAR